MIENICKKDLCTGCLACMNICPKDAIVYKEDEYGVPVAVINQDKCIECGACVKVCPVNNPVEKKEPLACYAAWSNNAGEREFSTSGGIAAEISKTIVNDGGVVFGAAFDSDMNVCHMSADSAETLQRFRGSKYVQSYIGKSYREIKKALLDGKKVLFTGTPCQAAGLRNFLGKEYDNLFIIDLICHGTPPMTYLRDYLKEIGGGRKISKISFREGNDYCLAITGEKNFYKKTANCDYYLLAFLRGVIQRENCFSCDYAQGKRCGDITVGDFWKLDRKTMNNKYRGRVSVVLINTENGNKLWETCKDKFTFEKRDFEEAKRGNGPLRGPSGRPKDRETFLNMVKSSGFSYAVENLELKNDIKKNERKNSFWIYRTMRKMKKRLIP